MRKLIPLLKLSEAELQEVLYKLLVKMYGKENVVYTKDYVFAKGKIPICLVAHTDTVHKELPVDILHNHRMLWSPQGIGGDCRAGCYALLKIAEKGFRPHLLFTAQEEVGCLGAKKFVEDYQEFDGDLKYFIEIDRRGSKDCVFYNCDNKKFEEYVKTFGFETAKGSCSDISKLAPHFKVSAVNLSAGYFSEHTKNEYIRFDYLLNTIKKVISMLKDEPNVEKFEYIAKTYSYSSYSGYSGYNKSNLQEVVVWVNGTRMALKEFKEKFGKGLKKNNQNENGNDKSNTSDSNSIIPVSQKEEVVESEKALPF